MKKLGFAVFLASTFLFALGVWIYETKDWPDYPIFFSLGSAAFFFITVFLIWAWVRDGFRGLLLAAIVNVLFLFLSIIPLTQKTCWIGSSKQKLTVRVLEDKAGKPVAEVLVSLVSRLESFGQGITDRNGETTIEAWLPASGSFSLFQRSGGVYFSGLRLRIETKTSPEIVELEERISSWPIYKGFVPEIEIRVKE
jgi:5-hydroxyisourate hydrolase-like protein (transthyretin family)